ncbi:MAG: hypothetical protein H6577_06000 [Lewinellaceae bacterium]|nr:hypothetical protein [Saprospiraceae bacterium]MCB9337660.1 hypothetical protein [Lewinellaceae bacterium]
MKNFVCSLLFLLIGWGTFAQSSDQQALAQQSTEQLTKLYGLDAQQQSKMQVIQERKYRNLAEIGPIKNTDPQLYIKKVEALRLANEKSIERILNEDQRTLLRQQKAAARNEKALVYKEMKQAGASQMEIDQKLMELDIKALQ